MRWPTSATTKSSQLSQSPGDAAARPAAPKLKFSVGDQCLLLYRRKKRFVKVPVVVVELVPPGGRGGVAVESRKVAIDEPSYIVKSVSGGTLHVGAEVLKPGTVLDRIVDALDEAVA